MTTLRVVSWNVDRRPKGLTERLQRLASLDSDLILLQEVSRTAAKGLAERCGFAWGEAAVLRSEPDRGPPTRSSGPIASSCDVPARFRHSGSSMLVQQLG